MLLVEQAAWLNRNLWYKHFFHFVYVQITEHRIALASIPAPQFGQPPYPHASSHTHVLAHRCVTASGLFKRTLTAQRVAHARAAPMFLPKYTQPATASDRHFRVPVKYPGRQYYNRREPSNGDAQAVTAVKG